MQCYSEPNPALVALALHCVAAQKIIEPLQDGHSSSLEMSLN
jgi:hypothetical protein